MPGIPTASFAANAVSRLGLALPRVASVETASTVSSPRGRTNDLSLLKTIWNALFRSAGAASRLPSVSPEVRVELFDLELEQRQQMATSGFDESCHFAPAGIEFRFETFNAAGELVCTGKVDHIPGVQVTVRHIDTVPGHRRRGYATGAVRWLSAHFGWLPVVPMDERGDGVAFWAALRDGPVTELFVRPSIGLTEASELVKQAEKKAL